MTASTTSAEGDTATSPLAAASGPAARAERTAPVRPRQVDAWVREVLGEVTTEAVLTRRIGRVLQVRDTAGRSWVVKTSGTRAAFDREARAYRDWLPRLGDHAPQLLAHDRDLRTLVVSRVPGRAGWSFDPVVHREAGRVLRLLHDAAAPGERGSTVGRLAGQRLATTLEGLEGLGGPEGPGGLPRDAVPPGHVLAAEGAVAVLRRDFADLEPVATHGDFGGHNWVREGDHLRVIDFADARLAPAAVDFARLWAGPWWQRPDLADAFFEGYGRAATEREDACVRLQLPVLALGLVRLGLAKGSEPMVRRGRHRLAAVLEGADHTAFPTGVRGAYWSHRRARDRRRFAAQRAART